MVLSAHFRPTHPEKVATIHSAVRRNMEAKIGKKAQSPINTSLKKSLFFR
jgi:hypothetical protein